MARAAQGRTIRKRKFMSRSGAELGFTELGFGAAPLGNLYRPMTEKEARATLDAAWTAGVRYYDTAPLYGLGLSETRLNGFLRAKPRELLFDLHQDRPSAAIVQAEERSRIGAFFETPSRREVFDYSYDGVMRSLEFSLERLGLDHIDIVYAHDVDVFTHGSKEASDQRIREFMQGGYKALTKLREGGAIKAIGAGINEWEVAEHLARKGDFDVFLLAGRYTLLEQEALDSFLPYCVEKNIGVVIGGPFNSGILATGPRRARITTTRRRLSKSWIACDASRPSARRTASSSPRPRSVSRSAIPPSSASFRAGRSRPKCAATPRCSASRYPPRSGGR